jgi:polyprenyl-phospho-N-acetylgalactosaminyl synthase
MRRNIVFIVIPTYNEDSVLRCTVSDLLVEYSVIVVDDGSATPARTYLEGLEVFCVRHDVNLGQGAALQTGTEFALSLNAQIIVHFDADGQHSAASVNHLIQPILDGKADVVLGSRFLDAGDRHGVPFTKRVLLKTGVFVSWAFTGIWLSDAHNGLRALSRTAAQQIKLTENGFAHATEILYRLRRSNLAYCEVPVPIRYTEYSKRKGQSVFNSFNILIDLLLSKLFR